MTGTNTPVRTVKVRVNDSTGERTVHAGDREDLSELVSRALWYLDRHGLNRFMVEIATDLTKVEQ